MPKTIKKENPPEKNNSNTAKKQMGGKMQAIDIADFIIAYEDILEESVNNLKSLKKKPFYQPS